MASVIVRVFDEEIEFTEVESSNIYAVGYDDSRVALGVIFHSTVDKCAYWYLDAPRKMLDNMLKAESKGKFFNSYIKHVYEFIKVDYEQ